MAINIVQFLKTTEIHRKQIINMIESAPEEAKFGLQLAEQYLDGVITKFVEEAEKATAKEENGTDKEDPTRPADT